MRFNKEKKSAIVSYLLEKLNAGAPNVAKIVSDAFAINQNTVHNYINELIEQGVLVREKRDTYRLAENTANYSFSRKAGEIQDEQAIFDACLRKHLAALPSKVPEIWEYILGERRNC